MKGEKHSSNRSVTDPLSRRSVLGTCASSLAALGFGIRGAGTVAGRENVLSKKKIYTDGVRIDEGKSVGTLRDADLAVFDSDFSPNRDPVLKALHDGTAIAFAGDYALETALGFLYGLRRSRFVDHMKDGRLDRPSDVDFTFGFELDRTEDCRLTVIHPSGDYLDIKAYHGTIVDGPRDMEILLAQSFQRTDEDTANQSGWYGNWNRVGTFEVSGAECPYGQWSMNLDCRKYEDSDLWIAWHGNQRITGGDGGCGSTWYNHKTFRDFRFPWWATLWDYGPETSTGSTTASVDISATDIGGSWSYSTDDVDVYAIVDETDVDVEWTHKYTPGTANSKATHRSKPTPLIQVDPGLTTAKYEYDAIWEWVETGWWDDYEDHTRNGHGNWNI